jgi:hypothetical protein|tara:strand:+ start:217 stop:438 length:222 start_codon:yes stop_codon:yes gene_type:complete
MNTYTFNAQDETFVVTFTNGYDPLSELGDAMDQANRSLLDRLENATGSIFPGRWKNGEDKYTFNWVGLTYGNI